MCPLSVVIGRCAVTRQFALNLLNAGQAGLQLCRQGIQQLVFRNAQRLSVVAQRVFGHHLVFALAQQQADGRGVLRVLDLGIDGSVR
jgi:hypothetical protein